MYESSPTMYDSYNSRLNGLGAAANQSPAISFQELATKILRYIVTKKVDLGIGKISIGEVIPGNIEGLASAMLVSHFEKEIRQEVGLGEQKVTLQNLSGVFSIAIIDVAYTELLKVFGVSQSEIDNMSPEDGLSNLQYIVLFGLSNSGPLGGFGRKLIYDEIKKFFIDAITKILEEMGYKGPETKKVNVFDVVNLMNEKVNSLMNNVDLSKYPDPQSAAAVLWSNKPGSIYPECFRYINEKYGHRNQSWLQFLLVMCQEQMMKNLETFFNFKRNTYIDPQRGAVAQEGRAFRPAGFIDPAAGAGAAGIPIIPIAIAGIAALLLLKKK